MAGVTANWRLGDPVEFSFSTEEPDAHCSYACVFQEWTEELASQLLVQATIVSINQAKVLLLDQYQKWRDSVPKAHQSYTGNRHICIFHVFDDFYKRLRMAELSLQPPMLFLPEPPTPASLDTRPLFDTSRGLYLGELVTNNSGDDPPD